MDDTAQPRPLWHYGLVAAGGVAVTAAVLPLMGGVPISKRGRILLWVGTVHGPENSQQVFDWSSPSHVIHGIAFYYLFRLVTRGRASLGALLVLAVAFEAAWEV